MPNDDPPHDHPLATPLDAKRAKERAKYLALANKPGSTYGSSNHGRAAIPLIQECKPRFVVDFGCGRNDLVRELRRRHRRAGRRLCLPEADLVRPMHATALQAGHRRRGDELRRPRAPPSCRRTWISRSRRCARRGAAGRFIFSICTRPSTTTVAGEGLHPTVRPLDWWLERIARVGVAGPKAGSRYIVGRFKSDGGAAVRENQSDIAALQAGLKAQARP